MRCENLTRDEYLDLLHKIEIKGIEKIKISGYWVTGKYLYLVEIE